MAKTAKKRSKVDNKSNLKDLTFKALNLVEEFLKANKISYSRKVSSVVVPEHSITIYYDSIAKKTVVLKGDKEVLATTKVSGLSSVFKIAETKKESVKKSSSKKEPVKKSSSKKEAGTVKSTEPRAKFVEQPIETVEPKGIVKFASQPVELCSIKDMSNKVIEGYKGVLNTSQGRVVSVVSDTYNLLPNKTVVDPVLNFLEKEKIKYSFDRFTYVTDQRMRLHFTFPEIKISDDTKDGILASVFLHNSYNQAESYRLVAGGMRQVCSNGMVIGTVVKKLKIIHQATNIVEISTANIDSILNGYASNTKLIEAHIKEMIAEKITVKQITELTKKLEPRIIQYVLIKLGLVDMGMSTAQALDALADFNEKQILKQNQWELYNILTYYASHILNQRYRTDYFTKFSKIFKF